MIERSFTDLLEAIVDNRGRTCPTADSGLPLIATNCIKGDHLYPVFENVRFVDEETVKTWFRGHPRPDDIIFVCKGSPGRVAIVPDPVPFCIAQDMVALRADQRLVQARYLYYALKSPAVQAKINNMHVGSMIPHFKKGDFGKLRFTIHENVDEQRAIAEVLGALDDKIAANTKLASASIELAENLFLREALQTERYMQALGEVATTVLGGTPSRDNESFWTGGTVPWLNSGKANEDRITQPSAYITEEALRRSAAKMMPEGTTVIAITGATLGQVSRLEIAASGNQSLVGIWSEDRALNDWLYFAIRKQIPELLKKATGAAQQHVNKRDVDSLMVPVAGSKELAGFSTAVTPLLEVAASADIQNIGLSATREALLPQLMSGKLRVKDAAKVLENASV
ncbi:restriction endonuclease subunit S [Pseudarthrobacter sp. CC12]|uniref:restriction endonuclease subunit S n=1 Tax=Pseudarthrobacter sp. CC12 TaxID=3029193 RepID=UPI003262D849